MNEARSGALGFHRPLQDTRMNVAIERAPAVMSGFREVWGIAGGWAIDLFLNRKSRPHPDIDLAVLRRDQMVLRSWVADGRVEKVTAGGITAWASDERLEEPIHEVHVTWADGFQIEFLLNECDQGTQEWMFRRDPRVRTALAPRSLAEHSVAFCHKVLYTHARATRAIPRTDWRLQ
jgi:hypothetical protein